MKKFIMLALVFPIIFFVFAAEAQFYKYYDQNGNLRFTDDINQIPENQRQQVQTYDSSSSQEEGVGQPASTDSEAEFETSGDAEDDSGADLKKRVEELEATKAELADEYDQLMKENAKLVEMKKNIKTTEDAKAYNDQAKILNEKLKAHDRKRKEFFATIEEYNAQIDKQNK